AAKAVWAGAAKISGRQNAAASLRRMWFVVSCLMSVGHSAFPGAVRAAESVQLGGDHAQGYAMVVGQGWATGKVHEAEVLRRTRHVIGRNLSSRIVPGQGELAALEVERRQLVELIAATYGRLGPRTALASHRLLLEPHAELPVVA